MPFRIQRVPRGLNNLLNLFGGATPTELEDRARLTLESLQFYGTTQLQSGFVNNAATAENTVVQLLLPNNWCVLFAAWGTVVKTATMTALRCQVTMNRGTTFAPLLAAEQFEPFGATETGTVSFGGLLPYPLVVPPLTQINMVPVIIGTDATANCSIFAEFGTL